MKIQRIDYINLDRSIERNKAFLENLRDLGVDMSIVHKFSGYDVRDFQDIADLAEFASRKFPEFENLVVDYNRAGTLGFLLSTWAILHVIKESNQISLVCHDDVLLKYHLDVYNALLGKLPSDNFKCLQIGNCEVNDHHRPFTISHMENQKKICPEIWENFRAAGDTSLIISPAGADLLIGAIKKTPGTALEGLVEELIPLNIKGCYTVVDAYNYYGWVHGRSDMQYLNKIGKERL